MENKEIEVGDFVRTKNNGIKRIDTIFKNKTVNKYGYETGESDWDGKYYGIIKTTDIVKHSKKIIDLIEVGDIVKVLVNIKTQETMIYTIDCESDLHLLREWNVKSIVTKEEFESREYKVGE